MRKISIQAPACWRSYKTNQYYLYAGKRKFG